MSLLAQMRRVVVKIGSSLLCAEGAVAPLRGAWLEALGDDIARLRQRGQEVIIVSSGAIALGRHALGFEAGALKLEESQAAAAAGQIHLAHAWRTALARHEIPVAQILLTLDDTEERRRYLNARNTLTTLLARGCVPVVNENDSVTTDEIRYGDNDRLAARVASMVSADGLVLLSVVAGLYTQDPALGEGELVEVIETLTPALTAAARDAGSGLNRGGMKTKIEAARIAQSAGCHMFITDGRGRMPLKALEAGAPHSWFKAQSSPRAARKQWIAGALEPCGTLYVDEGAGKALRAGKSLLPAGVVRVEGGFGRGDPVVVCSATGDDLARGLVAYASADAARIIGHKSHEIEAILGYRGRDEMIHRDDLTLLGQAARV